MATVKRKKSVSYKATQGASQVDVAELAGVSQAAVSRVFTPGSSVSEETRQKVLTIASQLGYRPNVIARSLVSNSTNIIALVVKRFTNPFYAHMIQDFTRALQELGYWTLVFNIAKSEELEKALPMALQYRVDGVIITSATLSSKLAEEFARSGTPVVLFNRYVDDGHTHVVSCDNIAGGKLVADAFIDSGHNRFAFVAGEEPSSTNRDREHGFVSQLQERGHQLTYRESAGEYSYEAGLAVAQRILQQTPRPDAIFCAHDLIAMGVMDFARHELNIKIPEELSVVGFDDIPSAAWLSYNLTTVRQPFGQLVEGTIQVLMDAINEPAADVVTKLINPVLIARSSSRNPS